MMKKNAQTTINGIWKDVKEKTAKLESLTHKPEAISKNKDYLDRAEFLTLVATNGQNIDCFNKFLSQFRIKQ